MKAHQANQKKKITKALFYPAAVLAVDGSAGMLDAARSKAWPSWVGFVQGRAEALAGQPELADARAAGGLDGVLAAQFLAAVRARLEAL